jgi:galactose-1-phosphate uridylyltransferase
MKLKRHGKEKVYDYKTLFLHGKHHKKLKELSDKEHVPMGKLISKLIDHYESSIR